MARGAAPSILLTALLLASCSHEASSPAADETDNPDAVASVTGPVEAVTEQVAGATPMEDRVATLGLINKRNNVTQDLEMRPGESQAIGPVMVTLQACERTAPWEMPQETGAFVQVDVQNRGSDEFTRIFSGWLFKNSPSVNVVEHPIYDVWVKDCAMNFPGEQ